MTGPSEKVVQANGVALLRALGARVWTLGTRRRRGDYQGTMQSRGIPDVWAFLPRPMHVGGGRAGGLWWEVKRPGGQRSAMQELFADCATDADVPYVCGDLDALLGYLIAGGWLLEKNVPHYRRPGGPHAQV